MYWTPTMWVRNSIYLLSIMLIFPITREGDSTNLFFRAIYLHQGGVLFCAVCPTVSPGFLLICCKIIAAVLVPLPHLRTRITFVVWKRNDTQSYKPNNSGITEDGFGNEIIDFDNRVLDPAPWKHTALGAFENELPLDYGLGEWWLKLSFQGSVFWPQNYQLHF